MSMSYYLNDLIVIGQYQNETERKKHCTVPTGLSYHIVHYKIKYRHKYEKYKNINFVKPS
jgi:hypothetical protein